MKCNWVQLNVSYTIVWMLLLLLLLCCFGTKTFMLWCSFPKYHFIDVFFRSFWLTLSLRVSPHSTSHSMRILSNIHFVSIRFRRFLSISHCLLGWWQRWPIPIFIVACPNIIIQTHSTHSISYAWSIKLNDTFGNCLMLIFFHNYAIYLNEANALCIRHRDDIQSTFAAGFSHIKIHTWFHECWVRHWFCFCLGETHVLSFIVKLASWQTLLPTFQPATMSHFDCAMPWNKPNANFIRKSATFQS